MDHTTSLIDDHAYTWHGHGCYCGRCLRDRHAPRWDLTPLRVNRGVHCRSCGTLLRPSLRTEHSRLARIWALAGTDQVESMPTEVKQQHDLRGWPPAHAALRDPHRGRAA